MDALVCHAVERAQEAGFDPNSTLKGLVITDEDLDSLTEREPLSGLWDDKDALLFPKHFIKAQHPLGNLANTFNLNEIDLSIILLCLAPELDNRYEKLYAYLQDDIAQRYPTVNLLMNILGSDVNGRFTVWERLNAQAPLRCHHLIECNSENNRPNSAFITYRIRLTPRLVDHLLGNPTPDSFIAPALKFYPSETLKVTSDTLNSNYPTTSNNFPMAFLYGRDHATKLMDVQSLCAQRGYPLLHIDLEKLFKEASDPEKTWKIAIREVLLQGAVVIFTQWEYALAPNREVYPFIWQLLTTLNRPVFLSGLELWEAHDIERTQRLLRFAYNIPTDLTRETLWKTYLAPHEISISEQQLTELASKFRFTPDQIIRAVKTASDWASTRNSAIELEDIYKGAQAHASVNLDKLASRVTPKNHLKDLILPQEPLEQIHELIARASNASKVHHAWGFGDKGTPIRRVSALFAGESGTGKTLAAEVIAAELGLVMYKIDLSSVVSKYIGETEKNLKAIFDEAQSGNAILFFDEADALFGKRSEVKDAHDRYANIEVAYLLQQIELYDGVAIMATNLRQNLDEAFTRRLDFVIDFPFPEPEYRYHIWKAHFPAKAPLHSDVNLQDVAEKYRLSGGNIRNAALASAYLAASEGETITTQHIRRAVRREHQKMGRLLDALSD
jgi:hypothetical protein